MVDIALRLDPEGNYAKRLTDEMDSMQSAYRKMIQNPTVLADMGGYASI